MRRIIFVLLLLAPATSQHVRAQRGGGGGDATAARAKPAAARGDVYRLGARSVTVPAPEGFVEALSQSDFLAAVMKATEDPNNEVLASHLPVEVLDRLKKGERPEFNFYTKVAVLKMVKTIDTSEADFAGIVKYLESAAPKVFDVKGPVMKSAVKKLREGLSSMSGGEVPVEITQPQNLGSFAKTKNVYSFMMAMTLKVAGHTLPLLCGASLVRVNRRVLFVFAYRKFNSEKDAEVVRDFTREWVGQILAANR